MADKQLLLWVRDQLHDVVGFSDLALAQYLLSIAKKAGSVQGLVDQLIVADVPPGPKTESFARQLFELVPRGTVIARSKPESKELTNAELLRQSKQQYGWIDSDDEQDKGKGKTERSSKGGKDKKAESKKRKHARKKEEEEEEEEGVIAKRLREKETKIMEETVDSKKEREMDQDQLEKDALIERMLAKDEKRTKKLIPEGLTKEQQEEYATKGLVSTKKNEDISEMRQESRRLYLDKRVSKEVELLEKELKDEEAMFEGMELTEAEIRAREVKKKILEAAKVKNEFEVQQKGFYISEGYETAEGKIDVEKRNAKLTARYQEEADVKTEHERWEEERLRTATFRAGAKDMKPAAKDEQLNQFVFEDIKIDFVDDPRKRKKKKKDKREADSDAEFEASLLEKESELMASKKLTEYEKLQIGRKKLPVYKYREEFLAAVQTNQVLIVSAETGSGKTTQLPQYLHEVGYTKVGAVACTQPRRVAAMSVAARVSQEMGCKLGQEVGYSIRFENCTSEKTIIKYMTDGMLLREFLTDPDMKGYSVIIIDEAHERTLHTDVLFGLCKDLARFRDDLRLIISSATLNATQFSEYFDDAGIFDIPGRMFDVDVLYTKKPEADYIDAAVVTVLHVHISQPMPGDILVFLTGQEEIEVAEEELKKRTRAAGSSIPELIICPIYSTLPSEKQAEIFQKTPPGSRKVVIATNIAETSLTIDGICYVVDTGFCKQKTYNPRTGMESLIVTPISQAAADQRKGRAGRTRSGKCFRLYTSWSFKNELDPQTIPEIQRTNMGNVVLMLLSLGIMNVYTFDFMDKPPNESLLQAVQHLYALGALNDRGELTKLGRRMAEFPLDPMHSKALLASEKYECSDEVITIVSMLTVNNSIFYRPKEKAVHADNAKLNFARGGGGDQLCLMRCYNEWKDTNYSQNWCYENYVQYRSMKKARDIREQLLALCERVEIDIKSTTDVDPIRKAVAAGFFFNCVRLNKSNEYETVKHTRTVYIHPSSVLAQDAKEGIFHAFLIYHELTFTTKEYIRQLIDVKPEWILEIAPHYYDASNIQDPRQKKKNMPRTVGASTGTFDR